MSELIMKHIERVNVELEKIWKILSDYEQRIKDLEHDVGNLQ